MLPALHNSRRRHLIGAEPTGFQSYYSLARATCRDSISPPRPSPWRLYDGSVLGGRPLIAHGTGERTPVVLDEAKWLEIRKRVEEAG